MTKTRFSPLPKDAVFLQLAFCPSARLSAKPLSGPVHKAVASLMGLKPSAYDSTPLSFVRGRGREVSRWRAYYGDSNSVGGGGVRLPPYVKADFTPMAVAVMLAADKRLSLMLMPTGPLGNPLASITRYERYCAFQILCNESLFDPAVWGSHSVLGWAAASKLGLRWIMDRPASESLVRLVHNLKDGTRHGQPVKHGAGPLP